MSRLFDDGSSQYLEIDSTPITDYPFSMSAWIYCDDLTLGQAILMLIDKSESTRYWGIGLGGDVESDPAWNRARNYGSSYLAYTSSGYSANTWHNIVGIFTSSISRDIYIDGGSKGSETTNVAVTTPDRLSIGRIGGTSPSNYFSGRIAEVGFWSAILSAGNITSLKNKDAPSIVDASNLKCYWPLIDDDDDDKGGYNMTAYNSPTFTDHVPGMNYGGGATLVMSDLAHSHALDTPTLTQKHTIAVGGMEHSHSLDNVSLTQKHSIIVNALEHSHSLDAPILTQKHIIAVAGLDHSHSLDNVTLTQAHLLAIAGLDHSHALDNIALTQAHLLALAGLEHGHTLDNVALTQAHILADVADLTHSHSLDNIVLSLAGVLVVNSLTHGHSLDTPTLTQKHTLTVADLAHSHALDAIELSFGVTLVVNDLTHLQSLDGVDLLQAHVLIVDGLGHSHTIGSVILSGIDLIEIQELISKGHLSIELVAAGSLSQELTSKGYLSQELLSVMEDTS